MVLGAVLVGVLLELLRDPATRASCSTSLIVLGLLAVFRFSIRLAAVLGGYASVFVIGAIRLRGRSTTSSVNGSGGEGGGSLICRELGDRADGPADMGYTGRVRRARSSLTSF